MTGSGRHSTRDPLRLGEFYRDLLGWELKVADETWVTLHHPGTHHNLAFALDELHTPPTWPAEEGRQSMQLHLDIAVADLKAAVADTGAIGEVQAEFQPLEDVRVMIDPEGHPFCLYYDSDASSAADGSAENE